MIINFKEYIRRKKPIAKKKDENVVKKYSSDSWCSFDIVSKTHI